MVSEGGRGRIVLIAKPISVTKDNVPHNGNPYQKTSNVGNLSSV